MFPIETMTKMLVLVDFGVQQAQQQIPRPSSNPTEKYITEHVLEAQLLQVFMKQFARRGTDSICCRMASGGFNAGNVLVGGQNQNPWRYIGLAYPSNHDNAHELNFIIEPVNLVKERAFKGINLVSPTKMQNACTSEDTVDTAMRSMKIVMMTYKYTTMPAISEIYVAQATRTAIRFDVAEDAVVAHNPNYTKNNLKGSGRTLSRVIPMWSFASFIISSTTGCPRSSRCWITPTQTKTPRLLAGQ